MKWWVLIIVLLWVQLADIVAARVKEGRNYGIILIPEGLIEHVLEVGPPISLEAVHRLNPNI